jgi:hypothetical protein
LTTILSSSELILLVWVSFLTPSSFRIKLESFAINQTKGLKSVIKPLMMIEAGSATFSGFLAAKVFGVVSAKN